MRDVFLCHASEDKPAVIYPLAYELQRMGITCWLDEAEIQWGDSIISRINEGLRQSRFVIVVLSPAFLAKRWPQSEMEAVLNMEISSGELKVLPLLVGSHEDMQLILQQFPLLNHKLYQRWSGTAEPIARQLQGLISRQPTPPVPDVRLCRCSRCNTAHVYGVEACTGCHGSIVYGATVGEVQNGVAKGRFTPLFLGVVGLLLAPNLLTFWAKVPVPDFWGLPFFPTLGGIALSCLVGGFIGKHHAIRKRRDWIRTFPR